MTNGTLLRAGCLLVLGAQACSASFEPEDEYSEENLDTSAHDLTLKPTPLPPVPIPRPIPTPLPDPDAPMCGGIAALPCPGAGRCVDNPYDDCDPKHGGADCGGLCVCVAPRVLQPLASLPPLPAAGLCKPGQRFDSSPGVCGCGPAKEDPCARVRCVQGTQCVVLPSNQPACIRTGLPLPKPEPEPAPGAELE